MKNILETIDKLIEATSSLKVGDKVQYTKAWLRSTGMYTGDIPRAKGIIKKIEPLGQTALAHIKWDKPDVPPKVNVKNLEKTR